jgi:threonine dehydratase
MDEDQDKSKTAEIPTLSDIEAAANALAGAFDERGGAAIVKTPTLYSRVLSDSFDKEQPEESRGIQIFVKHENMQVTASYKERGALNKLLALQARAPSERPRGVVAASAGNHAQGVACHAKRLGFDATIYMPIGTPTLKVTRTLQHGATVEISGKDFDRCREQAERFAARDDGLEFVHPFNDPAIIAGQGTVALEMLQQTKGALDTLVIPIGGGGLISGMAIAAKALKPDIKIIGVEAELFPTLYNTRRAPADRLPIGGDTIAEGIQVREPGVLTERIVNAVDETNAYRFVDDIILVQENWIEEAIGRLVELEKSVVEGAGAVGLAALLQYRGTEIAERYFNRKKVGIVLSGGNIDTRLLSNILIRDLLIEKRMARIVIVLNDRPGELMRVLSVLSKHSINVVDIAQERQFTKVLAKNVAAQIDCEAAQVGDFQNAIDELQGLGLSPDLVQVRRFEPAASA